MSKITASPDVDRVKPEELARYTAIYLAQVSEIINGQQLSVGENLSAKTLTIAFSAANVEVASIHGLGRAPAGYILVGSTVALSLYDGTSANSASLIYLRSSAIGTARVLVY